MPTALLWGLQQSAVVRATFESRVPSFESRVSSFRFRVSDFQFPVSRFKFRISSFQSAGQGARQHAKPSRFDEVSKQAIRARDDNSSEDAIRLYREALKLKPSWTEGWWDLGTIFYDLDRYAEARDALARFVVLDPKAGPGWSLLGLCEFELKEYETALEHLVKGHKLGPGNSPQMNAVSRYHLALLFIKFKQYEAATDILASFAVESNESPSVIEAMGLSVVRLAYLPSEVPPDKHELVMEAGRAAYDLSARHPADAQREYEELVARYPGIPSVHYAYGVFLLRENSDAALREFHHELEISPDHVPAMLQIAFEEINRKDYDAGLPFAQKAVSLEPDSFPARDALGRILLGMGKTGEAIKQLEMAVCLAPDSPQTRFALASAYARAGRKEDAQRQRVEFQQLQKLHDNQGTRNR